MKIRTFITCCTVVCLLSSCAQKTIQIGDYPKLTAEQPLSIVVMPPINETNHVEAKDYFYTTLYVPLCEKGYYVFSPLLVMDLFQSESAYDAEQFVSGDLSQFREILGADAAMFTVIKKWERNNVTGKITVDADFMLRSTKTGEFLYTRSGHAVVDTNVNSGSGGLLGFAIDRIATLVSSATTDHVEAGRECVRFTLTDMPLGKYSPQKK